MIYKVCACCKNEIFSNSTRADQLYVIRTEWYDYHKRLDRFDYNFYVKCWKCNSLIKITIEEASVILDNCGYKCEHYLNPLNFSETKWKDDYPNNFKQVDDYSWYNPNDIFKLKVEINISDDIVSNLDNAKKYLNNIQKTLNDNIADKKCAEAHYELQHILNEYNSFECKVKEIIKIEE